MKLKLSLTFLLSFVFCLLSFSQVPQGFNYQAIARDAVSGNPLTDPVNVRIAILADDSPEDVLWEELHSGVDPDDHGLFSIVVGGGTYESGPVLTFDAIDWSVTPKYIRTQIYYGGSWKNMGSSQLWAVPYSMVAKDVEGPVRKLDVVGTTTNDEEALFEVRNRDGQIVFAVYNEGIRAYVNEIDGKGAKGGFAIGSFGTTKDGEEPQDLLFVSGDSVRVYIDNADADPIKGPKGGFAIGGFGAVKGLNQKYLTVSNDSVRIYIDNADTDKGPKGGFAIGGYGTDKGNGQKLLTVSNDSVRIYINDNAKGPKGGFAIGGFGTNKGFRTGFLNVTPDSTRVYVNEPESETINNGFSIRGRNPNTNEEGDYLRLGRYSSKIYSKSSFYNEKEYASWNLLIDGVLYNQLDTLRLLKASYSKLIMTIPYTNVKDGEAATFEVLTKELAKGAGKRVVKIGPYNVGLGNGANNVFSGLYNTSIGYNYGCESSEFPNSGNFNILIGANYLERESDQNIIIGSGIRAIGQFNTILGVNAGHAYPSTDNIFIGHNAGFNSIGVPLTSGIYNIFMGTGAGYNNTYGSSNIMIGNSSGYNNTTGCHNTIIGDHAGYTFDGSSNVFIGFNAGFLETGSNKLIISNSSTSSPLIGGSFIPTPMVGINRMPTTYTLEVGGTIWANGEAITAGSTTWSDVRYKKDITPITNALSDILSIRGVKFNWKESDFPDLNFPEGEQIGVIAQDIEKILPQIVYTGPDGYKSVSYEKLTPVLVEAVKEQQKQIESQQAQIESQNQRIGQLEGLISDMQLRNASSSRP